VGRRLINIVRYEHHFFRGWLVAFKRQGRVYRRYFRDVTTQRVSLSRAMAWRDAMLQRLPPPYKFHLRQKPTKTGLVGVRYVDERTRAGTRAPRYIAKWTDEHGTECTRSFSVLKYGKGRAYALAVECRKQVVAFMLRPRRVSG